MPRQMPSAIAGERPPHFMRNVIAFVADSAVFAVAVTLIHSTTVMPSFLATLTRSEVVIGMVSGLTSAAWLLPQLLVASVAARLPRKKPAMMRAAWMGRPIIFVLALVAWRLAVPQPALTVALALICVFIFFASDAACSVPWFDILARALPHRSRGAVIGAGQAIGSLGGIGVGMFIRYVLGPSSPWAYPAGYAVLFAISGALFMLGAVALAVVYEPASTVTQRAAPTPRQTLASLPRILREDRPFGRVVAVKVIAGCVGGANAFYVLHATRNLGFTLADTGMFVSAQVAGSMTAGALLGFVQSKWGPLVHIRLMIALSVISPALALLATALRTVAPVAVIYAYVPAYFFLGIYLSGLSWAFFNWIMEYADDARRPLYIALANTLTAIVMLAPVAAGWLARNVSYSAVFAAAVIIALLALGLSSSIISTRRPPPTTTAEGEPAA